MFMPSPTSPTLLVAVAISFMMLGVALAALLMKFVLK
jgi:hypothetical protein